MKSRLSTFLAKHRPQQKWLKITWKRVKFLWWEIPWIDKAYVFGKRFHHLELGLILSFVGWILVIHDWFVHERPKVEAVSIEWETKDYVEHKDGSLEFKDVRIRKIQKWRFDLGYPECTFIKCSHSTDFTTFWGMFSSHTYSVFITLNIENRSSL